MTETERAGERAFGFGRDDAHGTGRGDDSHHPPTRGKRRELVDFGVPALTSRLNAAQRAAAAADADRERLGQDLHDGVQQRLTALRIRLSLAAEDFEDRGDQAASAVLNDFGDEVDQAIAELRAFAHGVYPALLTSYGLSEALASAARQMPQPITVLTRGIKRYPSAIETTVYFSCLAALDNAAKHAGAAKVIVRLWDQANALHFTITDSGHGFEPLHTPPGAGIANMRNRVAALGGTLTIDSAPAQGTAVQGTVPHVS
jgi:signal transduction histidine kinase